MLLLGSSSIPPSFLDEGAKLAGVASAEEGEQPPMKAIVIDDDAMAVDLLSHHLAANGAVEIVSVVTQFEAAVRALRERDYDLVFLDVELGQGNGIELATQVRKGARVIFVTGREHYAARAFELNALDYIVKPVTGPRLEEALRRYHPSPAHAAAERARRLLLADRVFLKATAGRGRYTAVKNIHAIVSSENYSEVLLAGGTRCLVRRTMQEWEQILPREDFTRIHRTVLINLHVIERIERTPDESTTLQLLGLPRPFPVSRRLWPTLRARAEALNRNRNTLDRHTGTTTRHRGLAGAD